jgi:Gpi18-like mannosyltransferase
MKRLFLFIAIIFCTAVALTACAAPTDYNINLLKNADFSDGFNNWKQSSKNGNVVFKINEESGTEGAVSYVNIESTAADWAVLSQKLKVERGKLYKISALIKVEKSFVGSGSDGYVKGAHLSVGELPNLTTSYEGKVNGITTSGSTWQAYTVYVKPENVSEINVELRIGLSLSETVGQASFKNVVCEKVDTALVVIPSASVNVIKTEIPAATAHLLIALFSVLFLALSFVVYEYFAKSLRGKVKTKAVAAQAELQTTAPQADAPEETEPRSDAPEDAEPKKSKRTLRRLKAAAGMATVSKMPPTEKTEAAESTTSAVTEGATAEAPAAIEVTTEAAAETPEAVPEVALETVPEAVPEVALETVPELAPENAPKSAPSPKPAAPERSKKLRALAASKYGLLLAGVLAAAFVMRIFIAGLTEGHATDIGLFRSWALSASGGGLSNFYETTKSDYPPGYVYILALIGNLIRGIQNGSFLELVILKLPAIIADMCSCVLLFFIGKRALKSQKCGFIMALVYAFNIAAIVNGSWWGQIDSILAALLLLTLYLALTKKYLAACLAYAAALLIKFQAIFILPVLAAYLIMQMIKNRELRPRLIAYIVGAVLVWFLLTVPLCVNQMGTNVFFIFKQYLGSADAYNYLTLNAFNFYSAFNLNYTDIANPALASVLNYILIAALCILAIYLYARYKGKGNVIILLSAFMISAIYMFSIKMHERYLFPALILLYAAAFLIKDRRIYLCAVLFSLLQFLNTSVLLTTDGNSFAGGSVFLIICSLASVATFIYLTFITVDICLYNKIKPMKQYTKL